MGEDPWSPPTESSPPDIAVMDSLPADWESELEATTCTRTIPTRPTSPSTPSPTTRTTTPDHRERHLHALARRQRRPELLRHRHHRNPILWTGVSLRTHVHRLRLGNHI